MLCFIATGMVLSCEKAESTNSGNKETEPLGTYIYNGEEYPVYSAAQSAIGNSIVIRISPISEGKQTTYAIIGINSSLEGKTIDVGTAWNNDDYYFIYEDPLKYYSQYRRLKSGSIMIKQSGETFRILADIILPDDTDFRFEYNGSIPSVNQ